MAREWSQGKPSCSAGSPPQPSLCLSIHSYSQARIQLTPTPPIQTGHGCHNSLVGVLEEPLPSLNCCTKRVRGLLKSLQKRGSCWRFESSPTLENLGLSTVLSPYIRMEKGGGLLDEQLLLFQYFYCTVVSS